MDLKLTNNNNYFNSIEGLVENHVRSISMTCHIWLRSIRQFVLS